MEGAKPEVNFDPAGPEIMSLEDSENIQAYKMEQLIG